MKDFIKKMVYKGVGLASFSRDKIEELVKEISETTELSEEEGKRLFDEFMEESRIAKKDLEKQVESAIKKVLKKMDIPTQKDLDSINSRLQKLEKVHTKKEKSAKAS